MKRYIITITVLLLAQNNLMGISPQKSVAKKDTDAAIELKKQLLDIKTIIKNKIPQIHTQLQTINPTLLTQKANALKAMGQNFLTQAQQFLQKIKSEKIIEKYTDMFKNTIIEFVKLQDAIAKGDKVAIEKLTIAITKKIPIPLFVLQIALENIKQKMPAFLAGLHKGVAQNLAKISSEHQIFVKKLDANIDALAKKIIEALTTFLNYASPLQMQSMILQAKPKLAPPPKTGIKPLPIKPMVLPITKKK